MSLLSSSTRPFLPVCCSLPGPPSITSITAVTDGDITLTVAPLLNNGDAGKKAAHALHDVHAALMC